MKNPVNHRPEPEIPQLKLWLLNPNPETYERPELPCIDP